MTQTLHVRINSSSDRSDLEDTLAALDAGESVDPKPSTLSVEDLETFGRIFRPTNLELLEAIADHEPDSIRELARIVGRHPPEVTENVTELADYGLVELEQNGRAKRPVVWYDEIDIDLPIGQHSPDVAPA
ncbi:MULTISPECIES: MarR family transcriptional regulator [Natrialbaceae]|uniref:Predicted transcriptional regulator n=2 Tax=Natrialbaceae TaxID=1644061 RepID=A0A1G6XWT6_9EURY|nr:MULTISPECIES: MarR family transcriptional regulator [Natrialbaceae]QFU84503.1 MarR family transcriptional regulator [Natronorubrum aibiense]RZV06666.1 putative transcriptional regulator [Natrinema hispanicum]SDD81836.1 Predicted transcriptional regulator [Natrinema hispanicum]SEU10156.1 Predicted transcriptional regulator [Natrinema hispanicum]